MFVLWIRIRKQAKSTQNFKDRSGIVPERSFLFLFFESFQITFLLYTNYYDSDFSMADRADVLQEEYVDIVSRCTISSGNLSTS